MSSSRYTGVFLEENQGYVLQFIVFNTHVGIVKTDPVTLEMKLLTDDIDQSYDIEERILPEQIAQSKIKSISTKYAINIDDACRFEVTLPSGGMNIVETWYDDKIVRKNHKILFPRNRFEVDAGIPFEMINYSCVRTATNNTFAHQKESIVLHGKEWEGKGTIGGWIDHDERIYNFSFCIPNTANYEFSLCGSASRSVKKYEKYQDRPQTDLIKVLESIEFSGVSGHTPKTK
jgi:hypothetical protein